MTKPPNRAQGRTPLVRSSDGAPAVYLLPGAMHCEPEPCVVTTILGSCVAVCLSDPRRQLSGINHFVLPCSGADQPSLRYGDVAIDWLVEAMLQRGASFANIEAKVFGGAAVLPTNTLFNNVGVQNIEVAVERLNSLKIPMVARRTGGRTGMALRLFTQSGEVHVRRIGTSAAGHADARAYAVGRRDGTE